MEDKPPHKTDGIANLAESQGRGPDADAKLSAEDVPILLSDLDHAALQAKFAPLLEGRLSDEEREALRGEDPLGFALFSPLPAAQADELATRLMNEIGVADPRGGQTTTASEAVPPTPVISLAEARARFGFLRRAPERGLFLVGIDRHPGIPAPQRVHSAAAARRRDGLERADHRRSGQPGPLPAR